MNAGGVVDVSKGREKYNFDSSYPVTVRKRFYMIRVCWFP